MERQLLLLGVLRAQKMHGYQLNEFLERRYDFITDLKPSTAYYLLDKLATDGYVQMHYEQVGKRPRRRVYEITPKGEAYFFELLQANLSGRTAPVYADEVGLAYINEISNAAAHDHLAQKRALVQAELDHLSAVNERLLTSSGRQIHRALDHHLALVRAELVWLDNLLAELSEKESLADS